MDAADRVGIAEAKHITRLYQFLDDMRERFPDILQENCASGGRRLCRVQYHFVGNGNYAFRLQWGHSPPQDHRRRNGRRRRSVVRGAMRPSRLESGIRDLLPARRRIVAPQVEPVYISSLACGLSWREVPVQSVTAGAMVRSPWSGDFLTILCKPRRPHREAWQSARNACDGSGFFVLRSPRGPEGPFTHSLVSRQKDLLQVGQFHPRRQLPDNKELTLFARF